MARPYNTFCVEVGVSVRVIKEVKVDRVIFRSWLDLPGSLPPLQLAVLLQQGEILLLKL